MAFAADLSNSLIPIPAGDSRLSEIEEDYMLLLEATERLANNTAPATPIEDVIKELGISNEELAAAEDVVIE